MQMQTAPPKREKRNIKCNLHLCVPPLYGGGTKFCRCALSLQYGMPSSKNQVKIFTPLLTKNLSIDVHSNSQTEKKACFHRRVS